MARNGEEKAGARQEWRQLVSGGGLFAAVLAILIFGATRETAEAPPAAAPPRATLAVTPSAPPPAPSIPPQASPDSLEARSQDDPPRLARSDGAWTLQLAVACKRETADRLVERASGSLRLYVLPATLKEQECFRLCWGAYRSRDEAQNAQDLPAGLRAGLVPEPRMIRELLP